MREKEKKEEARVSLPSLCSMRICYLVELDFCSFRDLPELFPGIGLYKR